MDKLNKAKINKTNEPVELLTVGSNPLLVELGTMSCNLRENYIFQFIRFELDQNVSLKALDGDERLDDWKTLLFSLSQNKIYEYIL